MAIKRRIKRHFARPKSQIAGLMEKHEASILNHDFAKFYTELANGGYSLDSTDEVAGFLKKLKEIEGKDYDNHKQQKGAAIYEHELPTTFLPELVVREHFLNKINQRIAYHIRDYFIESEKGLTKTILKQEVSLHENPKLHSEARAKMHNTLLHDINFTKKLDGQSSKQKQKLVQTLVFRYGEDMVKAALQKLREESEKQKTMHEQIDHHYNAVLYHDMHNDIVQKIDDFDSKVIAPFEEYFEAKKPVQQ